MNKKGVLYILHIKMTCQTLRRRYFKLADLSGYLEVFILFSYYRPPS